MQSVSECSKMYAECMQIHEFACSYICLLAGPWACMQFLSMSEQLTRISQCFFLQDQWEKLLAVSICCCMIYVCYKELAIAGCKWFWCYLMQLLDEVGFPTPISNEVCDGIMRPGSQPHSATCFILSRAIQVYQGLIYNTIPMLCNFKLHQTADLHWWGQA